MNMYIDESGSIHPTSEKLNRYFIIGIVIPKDSERLQKVYKLFVRKNMERLKQLDKSNKMFSNNGHFIELKGSCFDKEMKLNFIDFFCRDNLFEVRYIVLDNNNLKDRFISNKARTFNYLLKLFLINSIKKKYILDKEIFLHIDERNVKTDSKFSLEDYLNQELVLSSDLIDNAQVCYYDSAQSKFIQIADVFSNIMYSNLLTNGAYEGNLNKLKQEKYILPPFVFPQEKFENKFKNI